MEHLIESLPTWAILAVVLVYVVLKVVVPYINKGKDPPTSGGRTSPPPVTKTDTSLKAVHELLLSDVDWREEQDKANARFEAAMQRHLELDRKQLELLEVVVSGMARQGRLLETMGETLTTIAAIQRSQTITLETLARWQREDTGPFKHPSKG